MIGWSQRTNVEYAGRSVKCQDRYSRISPAEQEELDQIAQEITTNVGVK